MKVLRTLLIPAAAVAALILPAAVLAQQGPTATSAPAAGQTWQGHHEHHGGFMRMFQNLNLSDQQKTQIQQIMQQYRQSHPHGSQPDPQARKQMRSQVMNVLTPQQRTQLQQQMQEMRAQRNAESQPGQPPSTPQP